MDLFAKRVNGWKAFAIFVDSSILDVKLDSEYAFVAAYTFNTITAFKANVLVKQKLYICNFGLTVPNFGDIIEKTVEIYIYLFPL